MKRHFDIKAGLSFQKRTLISLSVIMSSLSGSNVNSTIYNAAPPSSDLLTLSNEIGAKIIAATETDKTERASGASKNK